jgi:hypothetical protein
MQWILGAHDIFITFTNIRQDNTFNCLLFYKKIVGYVIVCILV